MENCYKINRKAESKIIQIYKDKAQKGSHKKQNNVLSQNASIMVNFLKIFNTVKNIFTNVKKRNGTILIMFNVNLYPSYKKHS